MPVFKFSLGGVTNHRGGYIQGGVYKCAHLDAVLVEVDVVASWTVTSLAEDDKFLEEKNVSQTALASVTDDELGLT